MSAAMSDIAAPVVVRRERNEKNLEFGNSGSLDSVQRMLQKLAGRCYKRVAALGLSMEFDDVMQEMYVSYMKAKEKWNSQGEALFSTYCTTVCINNFNNAIKKMERERKELGMYSIESFSADNDNNPIERMEGAACPSSDSPEFRIESAQNTSLRLACLSKSAKQIVGMLLSSERTGVIPPTLRAIARMHKIEGDELRRVKLEILKTYGVKWQ